MLLRALLVAAGLAVAAAPASASTIVYACKPNLCTAGPAGQSPRQLTTDGAASSPYGQPSLSTDGRTLAFLHGDHMFVGDGAAQGAHEIPTVNSPIAVTLGLSHDGARVAWHELVQELDPFLGLVYDDYSFTANAADGSDRRTTGGYFGTDAGVTLSSYTADGRVLRQTFGTDPRGITHVVCAATDPGKPCERDVAIDPARNLFAAASSPDGRWIAAYATTPAGADTHGVIALYDASTGALVRDLSTGPHDRDPAFSPDSRSVAFARDDGIYVVPVAGGTPTKIVDGGAGPTWGGPADAAPAAPARTATGAAKALARALRGTKRGDAVAIRFRAARAGTLTLRVLGSHRRVVARGSHTFRRAGTATVTVRPTAAGRSALRRGGRLTVAVRFRTTRSTLTLRL